MNGKYSKDNQAVSILLMQGLIHAAKGEVKEQQAMNYAAARIMELTAPRMALLEEEL